MAMMTLDDTWDSFVKKYTDLGEVTVGKIANMKEFVKTITLVSLEETFVIPNVYRWREE